MILKIRAEIPTEKIAHDSNIIMGKIKEMVAYKVSETIMCFVDFKNEVMTRDFISYSLRVGKRVLVPIIIKHPDGSREMKASQLLDPDDDLESGTMGILEPRLEKRRFVDPAKIDYFVVAGLAFDTSRNRLGYGAGFHDSVLRKVRNDCETVAVAFDFQVFDKIPIKEYDVKVKKIVTELRTIT